MKIIIKIGLKPSGKMGVNIVTKEKYDVGVRAQNQSLDIYNNLIENFGELYVAEKLPYVGYEIVWRTKKVMRHGIGLADIDYKEKNNCPAPILNFGRKVYATLMNPIEGEFER